MACPLLSCRRSIPMSETRPVTGFGLLRRFPFTRWTWRNGEGELLSDPLAALRETGGLEAGYAVHEGDGLFQAIPLLDETMTPAYLFARRGRTA